MVRRFRYVAMVAAILVTCALICLAVPYLRLARRVDEQLAHGSFGGTYTYYASHEILAPGDALTREELIASLKRAGYREAAGSQASGTHQIVATGTYQVIQDGLLVSPDAAAGYSQPVRFEFANNVITKLTGAGGNALDRFTLGPQAIANLSDEGRERRSMVQFSDLPQVLISAIVSAEDKRFFHHGGIDTLRMVKASYVDLKDHRKEQGASTITMQLSRNLWLDRDKHWKRKAAELMIALHLEHKLSKQRILEYYCNQVYLGSAGTFSINGFGEAAHAYFHKDVHNLRLPEAAMLAGLIQRPSYFNPFRYPDRAVERRNIVLRLMHENKVISRPEYLAAVDSPLGLSPGKSDLSETQYFLDLAGEEVQRKLENAESHGANAVHTTLDLRLQRAAEEAVHFGMQKVDVELRRRHGKKGSQTPAQVALIALDPRTGEIKAIVGGRDYSVSQLDRVLARRPPGSVFKPFVYAAALNTGVNSAHTVLTPSSTVLDAPATFQYENQTYSPNNFEGRFHGQVTFRQALAKSMNVAAVRVGEMVGYDAVVRLAKSAGMNEKIQPTPAVALGAYGVSPLEIAGAYTVFANGGLRERPAFVDDIVAGNGESLYSRKPETRRVLDSRVAFLMVDMLQEVMRSGTAAGVRSMGFKLPAAGKTGTSHDGWFAGFTSNLLCIVWVGFDDYHELGLEGAHSALPIWAKFMLEASRFEEYRKVQQFAPPPGVVRATIDSVTGQLASEFCPFKETAYFIAGTQPGTQCTEHTEAEPVTVLQTVATER